MGVLDHKGGPARQEAADGGEIPTVRVPQPGLPQHGPQDNQIRAEGNEPCVGRQQVRRHEVIGRRLEQYEDRLLGTDGLLDQPQGFRCRRMSLNGLNLPAGDVR